MPVKPKRASLPTSPTPRSLCVSLGLSLSFFIVFCCVSGSIAQDTSSYYFPSQNRFVPSSGSFPRQLQQQQQTLHGFRGSTSGFSPAPGSYQEQLLFIANENSNKPTSIATSSPYGSPFGANPQFSKPNRQSDYYDISPRPFGVPNGGGGGATSAPASPSAAAPNGFTRSKAIRNGSNGNGIGSGSNSFQAQPQPQPQPQPQRANVPHQQTQFLAHFSETANEKRLTSQGVGLRPFGNGGFSPSSTRTRTQAPPAEDATPQAAAPYRLRNRFQPSTSAATTSTAATTSGGHAEATSRRYNRFGSNRGGVKATTSAAPTSSPNASSERPSFGRKPSPRRPVFISREVNEPVSVLAKRPFNYNSARLKLPRPSTSTASTTSTTADQEESDEQYETDQAVQTDQMDQAEDEEHEESASLEKLPLQEQEKLEEVAQDAEREEAVTVQSSSPEADLDDAKQTTGGTEETQTDSVEPQDSTEEATVASPAHEYEYAEEDEKATTAALATEPDATEEEPAELEDNTTELSAETPSSTAQSAPVGQEKGSGQQEDESEYDDELGEDEEYDYDEEDEEGVDEAENTEANTQPESKERDRDDEREVVSVVTTKSVVNGSTAYPAPVTPSNMATTLGDSQPAPQIPDEEQTEASSVVSTTPVAEEDAATPNVTESYVVVASIQTSRSINGARFLPFPAIEQEETKQTLSELERKVHSKHQQKQAELSESSEEPTTTTTTSTTTTTTPAPATERPPLPGQSASTESIIDKLDRVQSELSSGVLSGKYPIISQMDSSTPAAPMTTGLGRFAPHIRKFQPRTTAAPSTTSSGSKPKVQHVDDPEMDELAGLLPVGFKPKSSYKNRKITTTTTTTEAAPVEQSRKPGRNSTISRSFKNGVVAVQDVALAGLLPKGYKPPRTTTPTTTTGAAAEAEADSSPAQGTTKAPAVLESLFEEVQFDDSLAALLPKDYKLNSSTAKPEIVLVQDIAKFLPKDFKPSSTSSPKAPTVAVPFDDLSKFLPKAKPDSISIKPLRIDDIGSLLPPGFKLNDTLSPSVKDTSEGDDLLAALLPPGYKAKAVHPASTSTTTSAPKATASGTEKASSEGGAGGAGGGLKVVFPKGFHKRLGSHRLTTPHTPHEGAEGGPSSPPVVIKKGPPTRATTEFTGWPTPPTTPLSIDKLNAQTINFEDLLTAAGTSTTSTTTTTTTSTTTTTTPRPTQPGHCTADCDLEATIKIVDGVAWKPELLDHNTLEWKNLAHELEAQLNEVYSNAPQLSKWYKKVRIDSFSEGSVLVDYYVELANITEDVNTLEIKQLFHEALTKPVPAALPDKDAQENETDSVSRPQEEQLVKASYQMGKFFIDPTATEFSVIAKNLNTNVELAEDDLPIPQWAIVVIVIGVGSLVFVVIFGVTVLLNRQKRAKKTPIPLTNDMLNELKVNHMGGADNYGVDDFYNIDDPWNDTKQPIKPKRFNNSMHGSNSSNLYDSWRSTRHPHSSGDYFYDQQPTYSQKGDSLKRPHHHHHHHHHQQYPGHQQAYGHQYPDAFADAHQMYSYNNHASRTRYARDYDPDF